MHKVKFEHIENFRDCAAYPCRYGAMTPGIVYRSASLSYASEADIQKLLSLGIKSEIDLRGRVFWVPKPSPLKDHGVEVLELEVPYGESFADTEEEVPGWYMRFVSDPYFSRRLFKAILNMPKPLLFHCEAGKDRTGSFIALLLLANGVSREDALDSYNESYRGCLKETEARTKQKHPGVPEYVFHMKEETFDQFLDLFYEKYETIENYFGCIGLTESEADALSNLFGKQETSAGAVVFHDGKVLVEHMALGHYSMPKGHVEKVDGGLVQTATREIKEETGLDAKINTEFHERTVYSPKPGRIKTVHWFIAEVENEKTKVQPEEVQAIYFLSPADAMRVLTHEDDRHILTLACNFYFKD